MKKKGFTLIELLAVIVILAIIALIATPLVLKYIEKAREKAFYNSIEGVKNAVDLKVMGDKLNGDFKGTKVYTINDLDLKNKNNLKGKVIVYKQEGGYATILSNVTDGKYTYSGTDAKDIIGNSDKWVVSPTFSDRILQYKPLGNELDLIRIVEEYVLAPTIYYACHDDVESIISYFPEKFEIGTSIEDTMSKYDSVMSSYIEFVPSYIKDERIIFINKLKEKFGSTVTSNVDYDIFMQYIEEIRGEIPFIYGVIDYSYNSADAKYNMDLVRDTNKIVTVIPSKINDVEIKRISVCSPYGSDSEPDFDTQNECYDYRKYNNPIFDLYVSDGIEYIGENYFKASYVLSVSLPSTIKRIGNYAFEDNYIEKIILPEGLESVGVSAFRYNQISDTVVIPSSLKTVGRWAFADNQIEKVIIKEGVKKTNWQMFANNSIKEIILPSTLEKIENGTFTNNQISGKVIIPNNVTSIGSAAFKANKIEEVVIPESVETIGTNAFGENSITKVTIKGDKTRFNDSWLDIGFPEDLMPN